MENNNQSSRRKFIQQSAMAGAGLMLATPSGIFAQAQPMLVKQLIAF